jgi:hypothetical protein
VKKVAKVQPHLNREVLLVNGRRVQKNGKDLALPGAKLRVPQCIIMEVALSKAFEMYKDEHPNFPKCQRSFEGLKPDYVCRATEVLVIDAAASFTYPRSSGYRMPP